MTTTAPSEESAPPALFDHCVRTYEAMLAQAQPHESGQIVYEGFLTQLITAQLNLSVPYYTSVRKQLMRMGCIRQLKRGGGTAPSQWELIYQPTEEAFFKAHESKERPASKFDIMQEQINDLSDLVSKVERDVHHIKLAMAEHFGVEEE